mmetsp:Transcript_88483/g.235449  ORF Transcript_88483/g.235449 Transcript_88483/m.235449 type:complete len:80 (+) Transcript_88483:236-475(+)
MQNRRLLMLTRNLTKNKLKNKCASRQCSARAMNLQCNSNEVMNRQSDSVTYASSPGAIESVARRSSHVLPRSTPFVRHL